MHLSPPPVDGQRPLMSSITSGNIAGGSLHAGCFSAHKARQIEFAKRVASIDPPYQLQILVLVKVFSGPWPLKASAF